MCFALIVIVIHFDQSLCNPAAGAQGRVLSSPRKLLALCSISGTKKQQSALGLFQEGFATHVHGSWKEGQQLEELVALGELIGLLPFLPGGPDACTTKPFAPWNNQRAACNSFVPAVEGHM